MMIRYPLTAVFVACVCAAPAAAQTVDVRVRVNTDAVREAVEEIREAMRDAFGPETREALRRDFGSMSRDIAEAFEHLARTPWLDGFSGSDSATARQRNFPASQTDKETRTFTLGANGEFELDNISGDLRIVPGSGRDLTIEITRHARGRTEADARSGLSRVRVETTHRGNRATARTVYPNERQSNYSVSVDYVITAPAGVRVTAKTVSGDVVVGAVTGDLSISTMSGDIRITGATRLMTAKTASGDIVLRDCASEAALEAATMSGDVAATNVRARRLDLGSISGSVTARNTQSPSVKLGSMSDDVLFDGELTSGGRYEFTSHSGTVRLALDGRTGFALEARTFSGSVNTELPLQMQGVTTGRRANRNVSGTFGDGSATITATSFSGSVVITKR